MTYQQTVDYILTIPKFTSKNKQSHTEKFLQYLGNPQIKLKVFHVAGTNGKGSVCTYLNSMLLSQKKSVGLFTSPHLIKINERIVINGAQISDEEFAEIFNIVYKVVKEMEKDGMPHPTFFEFLFGMALVCFQRNHVEYAILETGLGGRLDATNVIPNPVVSIITSIGMDHMEILGNDIRSIAREKAGIIKENIPVIYADSQKESNYIIEETAKAKGTLCKKIGKDAYEIQGIKDKHIAFSCTNAYYGNTTWSLYNTATYQPHNAMLALEAMRQVMKDEADLEAWRQALFEVQWPGRMEEVLPEVYIDGAHNISAIQAFMETISLNKKRNVILFSAVKDKDYERMIACLCESKYTDAYVVTQIEDKRAADLELLLQIFRKYTDKPVYGESDPKVALQKVLSMKEGRSVYCLGSLYLAGMMKRRLHDAGF